jgi:hypothetical protein
MPVDAIVETLVDAEAILVAVIVETLVDAEAILAAVIVETLVDVEAIHAKPIKALDNRTLGEDGIFQDKSPKDVAKTGTVGDEGVTVGVDGIVGQSMMRKKRLSLKPSLSKKLQKRSINLEMTKGGTK